MQAMVLAAGFGNRLRPLTELRAKPACPVCDHPLLHYPLSRLAACGTTEVAVNAHHLPESIRSARCEANPFIMPIHFIHERTILGTGGGLKNAEPYLQSDPFILLNGDTISEADLKEAIDLHKKTDAIATMVLLDDPRKERYGAVEADESGAVVDIAGLTGRKGVRSGLFTGAHIFNPGIFRHLPPVDFYCLFRQGTIPLLAREPGSVRAYFTDRRFIDLGTPADYLDANLQMLAEPGEFSFYRKDLRESEPGILLGPNVQIGRNAKLVPPVLIAQGVRIGDGVMLGPGVVIGSEAKVVAGIELQRSVVWDGSQVRSSASDSIFFADRVIPALR